MLNNTNPGAVVTARGARNSQTWQLNNSENKPSPRSLQVHRLVRRHRLAPDFAAVIATLAFPGGRS
jgi:hypothetical protein